MIKLLLPVLALLLSGCVSQYSISEAEVQHFLNQRLSKQHQLQHAGSDLSLGFREVKVQLGRKPGVMAVNALFELKLATPLLPLQASIDAAFEAKPVYDQQQHAIYLRDLTLQQLQASPTKLQRLLASVEPQLLQLARSVLENQPIYVLDMNDSTQARLAGMTKSIEVSDGALILHFD